jgi:hypothetical protein
MEIVRNEVKLNNKYTIKQNGNGCVCYTGLYKEGEKIKDCANVYWILDYTKKIVKISKGKEKNMTDFYNKYSKI